MWTASNLENESDVEQKFLYPLLIEALPLGLGLPPSAVQTKPNLRRFSIGKGADQKVYFPDYLAVSVGFPLLVVEAKHPKEQLDEAYREARLYAAELNALYAHTIAPARYVIVSNGKELWYGYSDQSLPLSKANCEALGPYSADVARLTDLMAWPALQKHANSLAQQVRPQELFKPRRLLGGLALQNEEVGINTFGATLTSSIASIFNPASSEDRALVVRNAYVPSRRRERYVDPIDRVIRAATPASQKVAVEIEDSEKPRELLAKLQGHRALEHKVLLIVGSVGSGKSTFIDHLIEVALPRDLVAKTVWCRINMNAAPVSKDEIYNWLRHELVLGCRVSLPGIDFDDLETIKKVFGTEIQQFRRGVGKLYQVDEHTFSIKLAEFIERLQSDKQLVANAHVRFTCAERNRLMIVVLDNCDKKTRDEQLLMFEAAQWLQKEFRCLVVLPLRDETYDNHRDQPPLDTALKDLVFRIEPPLFQQVLLARMRLAFKQIGAGSGEKLTFSLPNGFKVEYPQSDLAYYLTSIVKSLFEHDLFARRMIVGLSGRNMRRALEIFLEFCNSGHIGEDQIFKIRQSLGNYTLPIHQVATVLLRMNRRFYDSDHSYIKNLFGAREDDSRPAYFCRFMILKWFRLKFGQSGTSGLKGYFPKRDAKQALMPYGLDPDVLDREFNYLLAAQCLIAEHLRLDSVADDDLVRLGPAGFVHLDLLTNINYLAAVAEDTLFDSRIMAEQVAGRVRAPEGHLRLETALANASDVLEFFERMKRELIPPNGGYMKDDDLAPLSDLSPASDSVVRWSKSKAGDPWFGADRRLLRGHTYPSTIINTTSHGHFVEFDDGLVGLVHRSKIGSTAAEVGDRVEVEILWVDNVRRKMGLRLVGLIREEAGDPVEGSHAL